MTIAEKRLVVEVLLCAAADDNNVSFRQAMRDIECPLALADEVLRESYFYILPHPTMRFSDRLTIAAYRLIENSPTLRREWFGGGR